MPSESGWSLQPAQSTLDKDQAVLVSMPSESGWSLQLKLLSLKHRGWSFYALRVGLVFATPWHFWGV
jgi:hypothetical protein